jgi:hypothetical protein
VYILAFIAFALIAGALNLGWDVTFRRYEARQLGQRRRAERPRALPAARAVEDRDPALINARTLAFVEYTRTTFAALDELINRFDLLRLRARARARFGAAFVNVERPRAQALALLDGWLGHYAELDRSTKARLDEFALGPARVDEVIARERERASWEFRSDTEATLVDTATDLDRAVIHMQQVVRLLESGAEDPYRGV